MRPPPRPPSGRRAAPNATQSRPRCRCAALLTDAVVVVMTCAHAPHLPSPAGTGSNVCSHRYVCNVGNVYPRRRRHGSADRVDGGQALGGPGQRDVERPDPGPGSARISPGSTSTTPSYSMPLASRLVTTWSRARRSAGQPAGDLVAARHRRDHPDRAVHLGQQRRRPPRDRRGGQLGRRHDQRRPARRRCERTAVGSGRSGMSRADHRRRHREDLRRVAVVGGQRVAAAACAGPAPGPGPGPAPPGRPSRRSAPGRRRSSRRRSRPRRPIIRHCIGETSCASSTTTCA